MTDLCYDVAHLGHVEVYTDKFDQSLDFYTRVYGLTESGRDENSAYLRAFDDYEFHTLKLTRHHTTGVGHMCFEQAVAAAQQYSDAWPYLAWAHGHDLMIECAEDRGSTISAGLDAGLRAVSLDERSALAHLALSSVYVWSGDVASALAEAKCALDLNPNDVRAGFAVGNRQTLIGDLEEGIATIKAALSLNPRDPYRWHYFGYLSRAYLTLGEPEHALEWARQAVQLRPDQADVHFRLALCQAHMGDLEESKKALSRCEQLAPGLVARRRGWSPYPDVERNDQLLAPLRNAGLL